MSAAVRAGGRNQPSIQSERFNLKIRKNFAFLGIAHHYSMLPRQVAESPSWEISRNEVNIQSSQVPFFPAFYDFYMILGEISVSNFCWGKVSIPLTLIC